MTMTDATLILSILLNISVYIAYKRERDRRALMCMCVGLPRTSDWWPLYSKMYRLTTQVEKMEED